MRPTRGGPQDTGQGAELVPVVLVSRQLTVSTGELVTGETEELEWLRWVESAELDGRSREIS